MKTLHTATIGLTLLLAAFSNAQAEDDIQKRLNYQSDRIERGYKEGSLSDWEYKKLKKQHREIVRLANEFNRNSHINRKEYRIIEEQLDDAKSSIYALTHNDIVREREHHRRDRDRYSDYQNNGYQDNSYDSNNYRRYSDW